MKKCSKEESCNQHYIHNNTKLYNFIFRVSLCHYLGGSVHAGVCKEGQLTMPILTYFAQLSISEWKCWNIMFITPSLWCSVKKIIFFANTISNYLQNTIKTRWCIWIIRINFNCKTSMAWAYRLTNVLNASGITIDAVRTQPITVLCYCMKPLEMSN